MKKPLFLVDAFTDRPYSGNTAGVVLDCADLETPQLQAIARELRASETAFPLPAREPQSALHLRWFTASGVEVGFCGHATLAALHVLVEQAQRIRVPETGTARLAFTCKAGRLRVELHREDGKLRALIETPAASFDRTQVSAELLATLGVLPELLDPNLAPQSNPRAGSDANNLFVALRDRVALARAKPDFKALAALCTEAKIGGVCLYVTRPEPRVDAALRYFAPHYGVDEDPVTGSASGQLAQLIQRRLPAEMPRKLVFTQGLEVGRPGRVHVEVRPEAEPGEIRAFIGGDAALVLRGELAVPPVRR